MELDYDYASDEPDGQLLLEIIRQEEDRDLQLLVSAFLQFISSFNSDRSFCVFSVDFVVLLKVLPTHEMFTCDLNSFHVIFLILLFSGEL